MQCHLSGDQSQRKLAHEVGDEIQQLSFASVEVNIVSTLGDNTGICFGTHTWQLTDGSLWGSMNHGLECLKAAAAAHRLPGLDASQDSSGLLVCCRHHPRHLAQFLGHA